MLETTQDIFKAVLDGVKKESIGTIQPAYFNRLINESQDIWRKRKAQEIEADQKRIDDLQYLRAVTDGVYEWKGTVVPVITYSGTNTKLFRLPVTEDIANGITINGNVYPAYWRLLATAFKIMYSGNDCYADNGVSDWLDARIMRSDQRNRIMRNPWRRPTDERLYYEIIQNQVQLINTTTVSSFPNTSSTGVSMKLEYLRMPFKIFFDETNTTDQTVGTATYPSYTPGDGCVNCELIGDHRQEIVDIAIEQYLERVKNPRYQSFMQEQMIKNQSN